jgi:single-stranded-DNA-specific exonuclease
MKKKEYNWKIISKRKNGKTEKQKKAVIIADVLLKNRGIKSKEKKKEFFDPTPPAKLSLKKLRIDEKLIASSINRINKAIKSKERIVIYGDYDADGVCATAILLECLYALTKKVHPHIPDRFTEGYGINTESIKKLKEIYPKLKLIITVDNGIVATDAINTANELCIDVIITDHHAKSKKEPKAYSIVHTTKISGAGIAWILSREITKKLKNLKTKKLKDSLDLAAIGTIADQMPLVGANRSLAKFGLAKLGNTTRPGLLALYNEAGIAESKARNFKFEIGTYEVNYIIAPRINAMGRMEHAIESLRLLCTNSKSKAQELAAHLGHTNRDRQNTVEEVVVHAKKYAAKIDWQGAIVLADESYHEGVIGLAASKLVEEYYRPAIVLSKGKNYSKASARSISGFNIIKAIREVDYLTEGGGGHPMAAGFTIQTKKIAEFIDKFDEVSESLLSSEVLSRKMKIDMDIQFDQINSQLISELEEFEPTGVGNPKPSFVTKKVDVLDARTVGRNGDHLKLILQKGEKVFNAIAFSFGSLLLKLTPGKSIDIAYNLEFNRWNGRKSIQLKIKDIKI